MVSDMSDTNLLAWIVRQVTNCQHDRRPFQHHRIHQPLHLQSRSSAGVLLGIWVVAHDGQSTGVNDEQ